MAVINFKRKQQLSLNTNDVQIHRVDSKTVAFNPTDQNPVSNQIVPEFFALLSAVDRCIIMTFPCVDAGTTYPFGNCPM